jgi:hypothetical protein
MRIRFHSLLTLAVGTLLCAAHTNAEAQGKAQGHKRTSVPGEAKREGREATSVPAEAKRAVVTTDRAIVVTREVLVTHGYEIVRVERARGVHVVYYRRGNMGRGRGKGPIQKMIIRPTSDRVVIEAAPRGITVDINVRLGL